MYVLGSPLDLWFLVCTILGRRWSSGFVCTFLGCRWSSVFFLYVSGPMLVCWFFVVHSWAAAGWSVTPKKHTKMFVFQNVGRVGLPQTLAQTQMWTRAGEGKRGVRVGERGGACDCASPHIGTNLPLSPQCVSPPTRTLL